MANGEIYEKNLSNASGIGSGDYLRTVNSNNESEKIDYTLLAKAIIEQWAGSTLAGSAQTVKSAIDALEGVSLDYTRSLTSSDDCNTLTQGVYIFSQSVPQNAPSGVQYGTLIVVQGQTPSASTAYNFQLLSVSGRGLYYRRQQGASGDVFANWTKVATKEEIDSLNSNALLIKRNGTAITSGADLDNFGLGCYYSSSSTITNTLSNCPITGAAFRLFVMDTGYSSDAGTYTMQIIIAGATTQDVGLWFRKRSASSGFAYRPWYKVVGIAV